MNHPRLLSRALLALGLNVGYWVLALVAVGTLGFVPVAQLRYQDHLDVGGVLAGAGALTLLWALRPRGLFTRAERSELPPVTPREFPALFALMAEVEQRVGAPSAHKVFLTADANASIHVERRWLGLKRERVVCLGMGLFGILDRDALASVVAHEYGHHLGGDLWLGPWVHRARASLTGTLESLEGSAFFLDLPFRAYAEFFLRVSSGVSREQELFADALAVKAYGAAATARALKRIHEAGPRWETYLHLELTPLVEQGARLSPFDGYARFRDNRTYRPLVARAMEARKTNRATRYDSHPPLEERLRAAGDLGHAPAEVDSLSLLGGETSAAVSFYERFTSGNLKTVEWPQVASDVLLPALAQKLAGTILEPGKTPVTELPQLIAEGPALWDRLRPEGLDLLSPEAKRQRARELLSEWLTLSLAERGFVPEREPGGNLRLRRQEQVVDPEALLESASRGAVTWEELVSLAA